jgi:hypothetical protein
MASVDGHKPRRRSRGMAKPPHRLPVRGLRGESATWTIESFETGSHHSWKSGCGSVPPRTDRKTAFAPRHPWPYLLTTSDRRESWSNLTYVAYRGEGRSVQTGKDASRVLDAPTARAHWGPAAHTPSPGRGPALRPRVSPHATHGSVSLRTPDRRRGWSVTHVPCVMLRKAPQNTTGRAGRCLRR